ncbi:MAG: ATP-binding cassette domain-containing protein [Flavobacteriales bacterium]|jgi:ABC-type multidrug transport system ATPase subunit|nr:ATP-binding cassette domain-containing protein [Flavobacteriales bacterium]
MVKIQLDNVGKRFNKEWVFRKINLELSSTNNYVVLGRNGSGKSTFLQTLAGRYETSDGTVKYTIDEQEIVADEIYKHLSICAPYLEFFEEYTLIESIELQSKFKPFLEGIILADIPELLQLGSSKDKQLKYYSSGMKQRVKLGLAILADTSILLLDEPTNNLDKNGFDWYQTLITANSKDRLIVVCSNDQEHEYKFCKESLNIEDFKK